MSNCGMVVVIWSPSAGVVFNSFVGSNLNLMLGDIPVHSSWLAYTHTRGTTWCNYATHHLVFNFLVDWNPFLVQAQSPVSQIPSMLLEARRITTTVVNRVYRGIEAPQARMLYENPCNPFQLMMCIDGDGITGEGKTYGCLDVATTHQNGVGTRWNQAKSGSYPLYPSKSYLDGFQAEKNG